jgi:two-component system, NarL family, invasion response regulator UvrY
MIDILIVDDHPIMRSGLRTTLFDEPDIRIADEAINGHEALRKVSEIPFDIVLLDISLPGISGFDVLKQMRVHHPDLKIIILTTLPEKQYAVRCLKAGAMGYLTKESAPSELITAIKRVAAGQKYVSNVMAQLLVDELHIESARSLHDSLSDREYQVLNFLGKGKTIAEIASILAVSIPTIHTYRARLLKKMGMESTAQLMLYVLEHLAVDGLPVHTGKEKVSTAPARRIRTK